MDSAPSPERPRRSISILKVIVFLAALVLSFIAGIDVGLHPSWIPDLGPLYGNVGPAETSPAAPSPAPTTAPTEETTPPATRPATPGQ